MGWILLVFAIVFEVIGTTFLKKAQGNLVTSAGAWMLLFYAVSFSCLTLAIKHNIELGVGYAIWSGVGTALIAMIGILAFNEHSSTLKFICIGIIILGVVGLKLDTSKANTAAAVDQNTVADPSKEIAPEPIPATSASDRESITVSAHLDRDRMSSSRATSATGR